MRWSRGPYLLAWAAVTALQVWVLSAIAQPGLAAAAAWSLQLLKLPGAAARSRDLGEPGDDAILALIPFANLRLWFQLNRRTPSPPVWEKRRAQWVGQSSATQLVRHGFSTLWGSAAATLAITAIYAVFEVGLGLGFTPWILGLPATLEDRGAVLSQILFGATGFVGLYTLVQLTKGARASRRSWWPTLLVLPLGLVAASVTLGGGDFQSLVDPGALLATLGVFLFLAAFPGAAAAVAWIALARAREQGGGLSIGQAWAAVRRDTLEVAPVHGGSLIAIQLGFTIVVPGIIYALQFALVDIAALLRPEAPSFRHSVEVTRGVRQRIFKVYVLSFLLAAVVAMGLVAAAEALLMARAGGFDGLAFAGTLGYAFGYLLRQLPPTGLSPYSMVALSVAPTLAFGAAHVGLVRLYLERTRPAEAADPSAAE